MSIPGFGDAIALFDLTIRITTFINDLRHAQDDLLGLHAEANTLRICINSVTSDSCHKALYLYITEDQGRDLKTITTTCEDNLRDLNKFIGSCAALIEKDTGVTGIWGRGKDGKRRRFTSKLRKLIAKGWARYKFTMTDKQAFRDKLVLPTQAVNVFLTSMTHVGLARMLMFGGNGKFGGSHGLPLPQPPTPAGTGTKDNPGTDIGNNSGGLSGWDVVGKRMAFKNASIIRKREFTTEVEEEVLEYIRHMLTGDTFTYILTQGSKRYKVTKARMTKNRSRSRSKSRGPIGVTKGRGSTFVMRKKSVNKPAGIVQKVTTLRPDGSDSDDGPRTMLALPAPEESSARYIDIGPPSDNSTDNGGSDDDRGGRGGGGGGGGNRGGGGGGRGGEGGGGRDGPGGGDGENGGSDTAGESGGKRDDYASRRRRSTHHDGLGFDFEDEDGGIGIGIPTPNLQQEARRERQRSNRGASSRSLYQNSRVRDLRQRQRETEDRIAREQEQAVQEMERMEEPSRLTRRSHLEQAERMTQEEKETEERYGEIDDIIRFMDIMYGVVVTLSFGRPPVDNGEVDSEDEGLRYDPAFADTDRLRAETSLPTMGPGFGVDPLHSMDPEMYHSRRRTHSYMPRPPVDRIVDPSRHARDRFRYMSRPSYWTSSDDDLSFRGDAAPTRRGPGPRGPSGGDYQMSAGDERIYPGHAPQAYSVHENIIISPDDDDTQNRRRDTYRPAYVSSDDEQKRSKQAERYTSDPKKKKEDSRVRTRTNDHYEIIAQNENEGLARRTEREMYLRPQDRRSGNPSESRRRTSYRDPEQSPHSNSDRSRERQRYDTDRHDRSSADEHGYYMRGARTGDE